MTELKIGSEYYLLDTDFPDESEGTYILENIDETEPDKLYTFKFKDGLGTRTVHRSDFNKFNPGKGTVIVKKIDFFDPINKNLFDQLKQSSSRKSEGNITAYKPDTTIQGITSQMSSLGVPENSLTQRLSPIRKAKGGKTKTKRKYKRRKITRRRKYKK